jgi:hypothetical protein
VAQVWGIEDAHGAARRLRRHPDVAAATVVGRRASLLRASVDDRGRVVERAPAGYAVPLDVLAVSARAYARTLTGAERRALARLRPGRAVLSETGAQLRGIGAGGALVLDGGRRLRVTGVVADGAIRGAELAVDGRATTGRMNVLAVLRPGAAASPDELARAAARPGAAARRERGAQARFVDPQPGVPDGPARPAELKARFGEPAVGLPYGQDWVRLDPGFVRRNLVSRPVPILGTITCHRKMVPALRAALAELRRRGLSRLVDPGDYAGCYAPRRIRPGGALSLHAWGLAVDLNAQANPAGGRSRQDRRLVRVMERHGFTWGGDFPTLPDPMHFEFRGR